MGHDVYVRPKCWAYCSYVTWRLCYKLTGYDEFGTGVVELCEVLCMCHMMLTLVVKCTVHIPHGKYVDLSDSECCWYATEHLRSLFNVLFIWYIHSLLNNGF